MKHLPCLSLIAFCAMVLSAEGQLLSTPADQIRVQAEREDYLYLKETVNILLESQQAMQKRIEALERELSALREENSRNLRKAVSHDELQKILDKLVKEIDQKRELDQKAVLRAIDEIKKLAQESISRRVESSVARNTGPEPYEFTVERNQTLYDIINSYNKAYKEQGKGTISLEDVKRVNPNLNPDRIYPGQKILIPEPSSR